ncbi:thiamine-triphosphatase-like [Antedon mediterranea]|uniref:thiamine-triphosphatase-like n=1 Tax=Antedon mediterranea TaxID=105859 RepID=UPI003AF7497F
MALEIERKFVIHEKSEEILVQKGGIKKREVSFTDRYFDTTNYDLSLSDTWLRKRGDKWQLKHPPKERCNSLTCQYVEIETDYGIAMYLSHQFPVLFNHSEATMVDISQCLTEFAKFVTNRKTYAIDDFNVDFDRTDFDFEVGEIELVDCNDKQDVHSMVDKVDKFAESLEFSTSERVKSKMEEFLQKFRPEHYKILVEANIL